MSLVMAAINIKALKENPFSRRPDQDRRDIIKIGRPKPMLGGLLKDGNKTRRFRSVWYDIHKWMAGCAESSRLVCWPCLLFSSKHSVWSFEGYSDWKNVSKAAKKHCSTHDHLHNELSLKRLESESVSIDVLLSEQKRLAVIDHNNKVKMNREILKRLIDITVVLSRQELAFRGHGETEDSVNKGNFR